MDQEDNEPLFAKLLYLFSYYVLKSQTKKDFIFFQPNEFAFFHLFRSASSDVEKKEISLLIPKKLQYIEDYCSGGSQFL